MKDNFANKMLEVIHDVGYKQYDYCYGTPGRHSKCFRHHEVNCSEHIDEDKLKAEYIKRVLMRKVTPPELEWIRKQPKVDLNDGQHEDLKKAIIYLHKIGVFENED